MAVQRDLDAMPAAMTETVTRQPTPETGKYDPKLDPDLDAVAVNLDAKIADSVQSVSKAPADRRRKRRKAAV